jgi:hypothetical protein
MTDIDFSFFGVQPIEIESKLYSKLITKKISFDQLRKIATKEYSSQWLRAYNNIYDAYRDLYEIPLPENKMSLQQDFFRQFHPLNMAGKTINLSKYLTKAHAVLYFDPRFLYFVLVYEIDFSFPVSVLENFLDYNGVTDNDRNSDLYNTIRKAFVKEDIHSHIGSWGQEIQDNVLEKIQEVIRYLYKEDLPKQSISIVPSTCNISNFTLFGNQIKNSELIQKMMNLNVYAERLSSDSKPKSLYNNTVYYSFNGRFHTIILRNRQDKFRFYPLQFHIQYMWFLVERYNHLMSEINKSLMQTDTIKNLQEYSNLIHTMINKIEFLSLHDMNFKHSIEIDIEVYEENEKQWSVKKLLEASKQYISFFKDYLERLFNQKNALFQKKLNFILLIISFTQLLALVSVWNDYLAMINKDNLKVDNRVLSIFGNDVFTLITFNIYLPILLLSLIVGFGVYLWSQKKKS